MASSRDRSGRDPRGIGGGTELGKLPLECAVRAIWSATSSGLGQGFGLLGMGGGSRGGSLLSGSLNRSRMAGRSGKVGVFLSGNAGVFGGGSTSVVKTVGVDFVALSGNLVLSFSCCAFFGGKMGRVDGS